MEKGYLVLWEQLVPLERGALLGQLELLASQDGLEAWGLLGRRERKEIWERRGL